MSLVYRREPIVGIAALSLGVGVLVGIVVGALGAGGGILAVPILVYALGQDPHAATMSSLVIVGLSAAVGIIHHARKGNVAWRDGLLFAAASMIGAVAGSRLSAFVPGPVLMGMFGVLLAVVAVVMLRRGLRTRRAEDAAPTVVASADREPAEAERDRSDDHARDLAPDAADPRRGPTWPRLLATATLSGLLTGFFGVGGGFIVVPMLVIALGLAMRRASGTSLLVMIIATSVSLLSRIGMPVHVDWAVTLLFAAGSMAGGALGGPLSARARPSTLTFAFAALLGVVSCVILGQTAVAAIAG